MSTQNEDFEKDDPLADLFSDMKDMSIRAMLPSQGKAYEGHSGYINVKSLNFEHEKALASTPPHDYINTMIKLCVDLGGVEPESLLVIDKLFVLYKVRESSFGSSVKMNATCASCKTSNSLEVDLSELPVELVPEEFDGTQKGTLPVLGKEIVVRIPTSREYNFGSEERLTNLWRFVQKIGPIEDKKLISQAIKRLTLADVRFIQGLLSLDDYGIQTQALYKCANCGADNVSNIPITSDFFTVS